MWIGDESVVKCSFCEDIAYVAFINAVSDIEACSVDDGRVFRSAVILGASILSIGAGFASVVLAFDIL